MQLLCGDLRGQAAWKCLEISGATAGVGVHKTLLQLACPGALLSQQLLSLLQLCLQGLLLHVQALLQLYGLVLLLSHFMLEALMLMLSLLCSSNQSMHADAVSRSYAGACVPPWQA